MVTFYSCIIFIKTKWKNVTQKFVRQDSLPVSTHCGSCNVNNSLQGRSGDAPAPGQAESLRLTGCIYVSLTIHPYLTCARDRFTRETHNSYNSSYMCQAVTMESEVVHKCALHLFWLTSRQFFFSLFYFSGQAGGFSLVYSGLQN